MGVLRSNVFAAILAAALIAMALANLAVYPLPIPEDLAWPAQAALFRHIGMISIPIALLQSLVLALVYQQLKTGVARRIITAAMAASIAVSAVAAFAEPPQSADVYAYIGYAKLPAFAQAYAPPNRHFPGTFSRIDREWGTPMVPNVYGPLWLAFDRLVAGSSPTLTNAVTRIRVWNLLMLAVLAGPLVILRLPAAVTWLVAINPFVWNYFIFSAHNDIIPIVCVVAAIAVIARWPAAAIGLAATAALCKISFFLVGLVPFALVPDLRRRIAYAAATIGIAALGSWFAGGRAYIDAIRLAGTRFAPQPTVAHSVVIALHVALACVAVAAVAVALFRRRYAGSAAWSFMALGAYYCSWYAFWGLPYALVARRGVAAFLISLPIVGAVIFSPFTRFFQPEVVVLLALAGTAVELWRRTGRPRVPARLTASEQLA